MGRPKRPKKARNNRETKHEMKQKSNQHNADTAKFWREKNHRTKRRLTNRANKTLVFAIEKGIFKYVTPESVKLRRDYNGRRSSHFNIHSFNLGDVWPTGGLPREETTEE